MSPEAKNPIRRGHFNTNASHRVRYTLWAPVYDWIAWSLNSKRRRAITLAHLQPGEKVLLVGAGTGLDLQFLDPSQHIAAVDLTAAMLSRLRRRAQRLNLDVDARVMDAQALEFQDASFDAVLLHFIVAVVPDPVRCLKEARRVLRSGGRVVILDKFVPDQAQPGFGLRLLQPAFSFFATEITRKLGPILTEAGLSIISEEPAGFNGFLKIVLARPG